MFAYYTIQRGDTLKSIADKFGTNTELLQKEWFLMEFFLQQFFNVKCHNYNN